MLANITGYVLSRRIKSRLLWLLCLTLFGIITALGLVAGQGVQVGEQGGQVVSRLSAQDPRPLANAIQILEARTGIAITYEDPLYVHSSEVTDVTSTVRRDISNFRPGEAPKVLIPKGGTIAVDYNVIPGTNRPTDPETVVQQLVSAHNLSGNAGRFRVEKSGQIIHVIPTAYKNREGALTPQPPVLDAIISLPGEERTGLQTLEAICDAVSRETQIQVVLGTVPLNLFIRHHDRQEWVNQKARDILVSLLESTKQGVNLSWRLLYDPTVGRYALNIHAVPAAN